MDMRIQDIQYDLMQAGYGYEEHYGNGLCKVSVNEFIFTDDNSAGKWVSVHEFSDKYRYNIWEKIYNKYTSPKTEHKYVCISDGKASVVTDRAKRNMQEFLEMLEFYNGGNPDAQWYPVDRELDI